MNLPNWNSLLRKISLADFSTSKVYIYQQIMKRPGESERALFSLSGPRVASWASSWSLRSAACKKKKVGRKKFQIFYICIGFYGSCLPTWLSERRSFVLLSSASSAAVLRCASSPFDSSSMFLSMHSSYLQLFCLFKKLKFLFTDDWLLLNHFFI